MSTFSSSLRRAAANGFTLIELVVGLTLTVLLALAVAPLWLSTEAESVLSIDTAIGNAQAEVTGARLERDLRLASCEGCAVPSGCALLLAEPSLIVFLSRGGGSYGPELIEWEVTGNSLMRRRGRWPGAVPAAFSNALFTDHKTMLESLSSETRFFFVRAGIASMEPMEGGELDSVEAVMLQGAVVATCGRTTRRAPFSFAALLGS